MILLRFLSKLIAPVLNRSLTISDFLRLRIGLYVHFKLINCSQHKTGLIFMTTMIRVKIWLLLYCDVFLLGL